MTIFDATLYSGKPDIVLGMSPIERWGKSQIEDPREGGNYYGITGAAPIYMDNEFSPDNEQIDALNRIHEKFPALRVGTYRRYPIRDFWRAIKGEGDAGYEDWLAENAGLMSVASKMDIIYPSLYTFYESVEGWEKYARANIAEAQKYGRDVMPFLWFDYHNAANPSSNAGTPIPDAFFRRQIEVCLELTGNCVIWGGWGNGGPRVWSNNLPWYQVVREFS